MKSSARCTFCSCTEPATFVLVGRQGGEIPLCEHHAALVGTGEGDALRELAPAAAVAKPHIDQRRLLVAAVAGRS